MLPEQIKNFREMVTLKDGAYILLRPMNSVDENLLIAFYSAVSDDDMRYFRHHVKDPNLIHTWSETLDYSKVLPILALVKIMWWAALRFTFSMDQNAILVKCVFSSQRIFANAVWA